MLVRLNLVLKPSFCFMQFFFMHTAWLFTPTTISIYSIYFLFQSQVPVGIKSGNYNKVRDWYVFAFRNVLCLVWSVELSFFVCYVTSKVLRCLFSCVKRERSVFVCVIERVRLSQHSESVLTRLIADEQVIFSERWAFTEKIDDLRHIWRETHSTVWTWETCKDHSDSVHLIYLDFISQKGLLIH